jgi:hypothetical protein
MAGLDQEQELQGLQRSPGHRILHHKRTRYPAQCFESGFNQVSGSGSGFGILIRTQEGKKDPQKKKKFHVLNGLMFSFEGCSLAVLYGGLGIGKLQFLI